MKIVQINVTYGTGSTGRTTKELHNALKQNGHDSFVFCTNQEDKNAGIYCVGTKFSRATHSFLSRVTGLQGYFSYFSTRKLLKKLDEIQPDIVHLRNLHSNYIYVNMLLKYLADRKTSTVINLDDCWFFTGHCCHYLEDNCNRWMENCGNCPARKKWNKSWFFDRSFKVLGDRKRLFRQLSSLTVIGVSDWILNESKKSFLKMNARFVKIYNWIDLDIFNPPEHVIEKSTPIVLSISSAWIKTKGLFDVLQLAERFPNYQFVMIGRISEEITIPGNVLILGLVDDINVLVDWYRKADVFLHLSYQETFGKVVAEALACGTPAIVYDITALPELIGSGCGYTITVGDVDEAAEKLVQIINIGKTEFSNSCVSFVKKNFNKTELIRNTIELYSSLL